MNTLKTIPLICFLVISLPNTMAVASENICISAAKNAEKKHALPAGVLQAIALIETGRTENKEYNAWPWTTNTGGRGAYHASKREAIRFIQNKVNSGSRSIDIGCFQINAKWHGHAFKSLNDMLDPAQSADYAARYLTKLKNDVGNWSDAIGSYHSKTPKRRKYYFSKVSAALANMDTSKSQPKTQPAAPRIAAQKNIQIAQAGETSTAKIQAIPVNQGPHPPLIQNRENFNAGTSVPLTMFQDRAPLIQQAGFKEIVPGL